MADVQLSSLKYEGCRKIYRACSMLLLSYNIDLLFKECRIVSRSFPCIWLCFAPITLKEQPKRNHPLSDEDQREESHFTKNKRIQVQVPNIGGFWSQSDGIALGNHKPSIGERLLATSVCELPWSWPIEADEFHRTFRCSRTLCIPYSILPRCKASAHTWKRHESKESRLAAACCIYPLFFGIGSFGGPCRCLYSGPSV